MPQQKSFFNTQNNRACAYCVSGGGAIHSFDCIITLKNLYIAWGEFLKDKKCKKDVGEFSMKLHFNLRNLYFELKNKSYKHSNYTHFKINDPKPRDIHKAEVRDRILHHLIYKALYPYFDKKFIYDLYSCRLNKGTHKAIYRFESFSRIVSRNNTKTVYVLKCDIKKFFANIDHETLKEILTKHIQHKDILNLLSNIIDSFSSSHPIGKTYGVGLPLGNLTSQLLVNIYMNEFDQYVKHKLKVKYYIRYADDFVILSQDKPYLENVLIAIQRFLNIKLKLELHPDKVFIKTLSSGIDFLGFVHFPSYRVLRTATKKRMFRNLEANNYKEESVSSYLGMLSHGEGYKIQKKILDKMKTLN